MWHSSKQWWIQIAYKYSSDLLYCDSIFILRLQLNQKLLNLNVIHKAEQLFCEKQ
jgi:hypothetical protein